MFKVCEQCKKKTLWFLVKQREFKPNKVMPLIKSERKMCNKCMSKLKKYFSKQNIK